MIFHVSTANKVVNKGTIISADGYQDGAATDQGLTGGELDIVTNVFENSGNIVLGSGGKKLIVAADKITGIVPTADDNSVIIQGGVDTEIRNANGSVTTIDTSKRPFNQIEIQYDDNDNAKIKFFRGRSDPNSNNSYRSD